MFSLFKNRILEGVESTLESLRLKLRSLHAKDEVYGHEIREFVCLEERRVFEPYLIGSMEVPSNSGFYYNGNLYNEKHNFIILSPFNNSIHFFDVDGMVLVNNRQGEEIASPVVQISYCIENDSYLFGCSWGEIYSYNVETHNFRKINKIYESAIQALSFIDENRYVFSSSGIGQLYYSRVNDEIAIPIYSNYGVSCSLYHHKERKLLFCGLDNGKLTIHSTKDDRFQMVQTVQAHRRGESITTILMIKVKEKEYIVTGGDDHAIKFWQFVKGTLRLVRLIATPAPISNMVYLECDQILATTHHSDSVMFWKCPHGHLMSTLNVGFGQIKNIFLMKERNLLGVTDASINVLKFIKLDRKYKVIQ